MLTLSRTLSCCTCLCVLSESLALTPDFVRSLSQSIMLCRDRTYDSDTIVAEGVMDSTGLTCSCFEIHDSKRLKHIGCGVDVVRLNVTPPGSVTLFLHTQCTSLHHSPLPIIRTPQGHQRRVMRQSQRAACRGAERSCTHMERITCMA